MNEIDEILDSPSYRFFVEVKDTLPSLKCDNESCVENNLTTSHMYLVTNDHGNVNFNVIKDNVCCNAFESKLRREVSDIYERHKPKS